VIPMTRSTDMGSFDPFEDFDRVFDEMRRQMDEMMRSATLGWPEEGPGLVPVPDPIDRLKRKRPSRIQEGEFRILEDDRQGPEEPLTDVREKDGAMMALVEMPGISMERIHADVKGKKLHVWVEDGHYDRTIALPSSAKASSLTTGCRNGVLQISMQKAPSRKPKCLKDPA
jgi:HSP20 family molecular chaperone IbpA